MQDVVLPKEHCDDRVDILQADARQLDVRELFTKSEVSLNHRAVIIYSSAKCR